MRPLSLLPVVFAALPVTLSAQTLAAKSVDSARTEIDAAVAANDSARLASAGLLLDHALVTYPGDPYLQHYRGYVAYRQVIDLYRTGRMSVAAPLIDRATADLQASSAKLQWSETFALLATVTGLRIVIDPSDAVTLGPLAGELSAHATQLGPDNPRVLYLQAVAALNTPPEYGGGVEVARALIKRSLDAFKTNTRGPLAPSWGLREATGLEKQIHPRAPVGAH